MQKHANSQTQIRITGGIQTSQQDDFGDHQIEAQIAMHMEPEIATQVTHSVENDDGQSKTSDRYALADDSYVIQSYHSLQSKGMTCLAV